MAVAVVAVAATINDIYQIASGNVSAILTSSTDKGDAKDNVQITNSYKIITPWVQYGYAFWLNNINRDIKKVIAGTTSGLVHEWLLHNVAYVGSSVLGLDRYAAMAQSVDVGKTLFADSHGGLIEHGMKVSYLLLNPLNAIIDMIINGGYN